MIEISIERKRTEKEYEGLRWETVWHEKNCYQLDKLIYAKVECNVITPIGVGVITELIRHLVTNIDENIIKNPSKVTKESIKLLNAIKGMIDILMQIATEYESNSEPANYIYRIKRSVY